MKLWVVVSDCGLNGPWVHGVYSYAPDQEAIDAFVNAQHVTPDAGGRDIHWRVSGTTGYQNTEVKVFELDGDLQ